MSFYTPREGKNGVCGTPAGPARTSDGFLGAARQSFSNACGGAMRLPPAILVNMKDMQRWRAVSAGRRTAPERCDSSTVSRWRGL